MTPVFSFFTHDHVLHDGKDLHYLQRRRGHDVNDSQGDDFLHVGKSVPNHPASQTDHDHQTSAQCSLEDVQHDASVHGK